jgi:preprotein translocase subunit SecE
MADKAIEKKQDGKKPVAKNTKDKKPSVFSKLAKYFRECKGEVRKIVWPTPKATFKNMGIVLVVIAIIGLFVFGFDQGLYALFSLFMDIKVG